MTSEITAETPLNIDEKPITFIFGISVESEHIVISTVPYREVLGLKTVVVRFKTNRKPTGGMICFDDCCFMPGVALPLEIKFKGFFVTSWMRTGLEEFTGDGVAAPVGK